MIVGLQFMMKLGRQGSRDPGLAVLCTNGTEGKAGQKAPGRLAAHMLCSQSSSSSIPFHEISFEQQQAAAGGSNELWRGV